MYLKAIELKSEGVRSPREGPKEAAGRFRTPWPKPLSSENSVLHLLPDLTVIEVGAF